MLLDQAIAEVQQIAGWRSDKATQIQAALQYAQTEREKPGLSFPWWLKKRSSLILTIGQPAYAYPSDYIQDSEESQGNLYIYTIPGQTNSRTVFLHKRSFEEAQVRYFGPWPYLYSTPTGEVTDQTQTIGPGMPVDYVQDASGLFLYPVPDATYTLVWSYWGNDIAQALGATNGWLTYAPWVLIGDAAKKICADLQNQAGVATAQEVLSKAESNLFRSVVAREESGRRRYMGSKL
jgi:hypothetical protein